MVWQARTSPYGEILKLGTNTIPNPIRLPGQYEDSESGLYYNRFRYYSPQDGGYINRDPIGLLGGDNLYDYPRDPVKGVDPFGLQGDCIPKREKPWIPDGNSKEGWIHIDERHITGNSPKGPGDLFASGTTRDQLQAAANKVVDKGNLTSNLSQRVKTYQKTIKVNGKRDLVRVVVDSQDHNRVITMFPVRGG